MSADGIRPTDEQLAEWNEAYSGGGTSFPEYYQEDHYELIQGMISELIAHRKFKAILVNAAAAITKAEEHV
ncbi:hypothetical protein PXH69_24375 [Rhodococcus qingshengii]|uniref:Uncharacterized protein n=1 Tax=Rhodococcus qingshengii TaxID=334542 RepID=A0AAW6LKB6_RHOSG|nr:hypothetical protein [Rhodococcus qingshengii]MDE8648107.1 hypothetical protein [Rhodococcus qingshengii]